MGFSRPRFGVYAGGKSNNKNDTDEGNEGSMISMRSMIEAVFVIISCWGSRRGDWLKGLSRLGGCIDKSSVLPDRA